MDDYVEYVNDARHVYFDEVGARPAVEDMVSFLSSCPELSRRDYTWDLFKLCCLCLGHVASKLPDVSLGSCKVGLTSVDLSSVIEPIQGYLLSCVFEGKFFNDPEPISSCLELIETFCGKILQSDYNPWESVEVQEYEKIRGELEKAYKALRVESDVGSASSLSKSVFVP